mgnify:CR=1 FL=1
MNKFEVAGKGFRYLCDASEHTWKLSRKFLEGEGFDPRLAIRKLDDSTYGVVNRSSGEIVFVEWITFLLWSWK